jgi:hypothetical protein
MRAVSRRGRHEGRPARRRTRLMRPALARRSARRGTPGAAPPFLPHSTCATCRARLGQAEPTVCRPPNGVAAVLCARTPPCRAHAADVSVNWCCANRLARPRIKPQAPRSRVTIRAPPPRHCWAHAELPLPHDSTTAQPPPRLPWYPVNLAAPLNILLRPGIAGIGAARGHRRPAPLRKLAGNISAKTPVTNRARVNPTSIPATSPASPAAGLAGISPAAPPPSSKGYIVRLQVFSGCFA